MPTSKQLARIRKEYLKKQPEEIAAGLGVSRGAVLQALGLREQLWAYRLEELAGWLICALVVAAPLVFKSDLSNFTDLPQRTFVQALTARSRASLTPTVTRTSVSGSYSAPYDFAT